jgi:hypothetical protein
MNLSLLAQIPDVFLDVKGVISVICCHHLQQQELPAQPPLPQWLS